MGDTRWLSLSQGYGLGLVIELGGMLWAPVRGATVTAEEFTAARALYMRAM